MGHRLLVPSPRRCGPRRRRRLSNAGAAAACAFRADLADADAIDRLFTEVDESFGRLSLLVNNAGKVSPSGTVDTYTAERLESVLRLNVTAASWPQAPLCVGCPHRMVATAA